MAYELKAPYAIRQFEVETWIPLRVFGWDLSFTNVSSAMVTTVAALAILLWFATRNQRIVPGRLQASAEWIYGFVAKTVIDTAGPHARAHIPFVFTLFVFIVFGTLIGLSPMKETFTTHLIITAALALLVFGHVIETGLRQRGTRFFRQFLPAATPVWLAPMIILVELISYFARPITLGVRLFANMFAGHMLIKLFGDFAAMMVDRLGAIGVITALAPVALMIVLLAFEVLVVVIQSYIFILLTCVYIRSSIEVH
jgi:F-type H+-transporting ATPase subunit a